MRPQATASNTVGPFFSIGLTQLNIADLAGPEVPGERVAIRGRVLDGDGMPVGDAVIEIWQANAFGKYAHPEDTQDRPLAPGFKGFGRVPTDDDGAFRLRTIKPGCVPGPGGTVQAPHLVVTVFMRGLLKHLLTRMYFPDEPSNDQDPVLQLVPPERRRTLIATEVVADLTTKDHDWITDGLTLKGHGRATAPEGADAAPDVAMLEWDIVLQGEDETVFFEC